MKIGSVSFWCVCRLFILNREGLKTNTKYIPYYQQMSSDIQKYGVVKKYLFSGCHQDCVINCVLKYEPHLFFIFWYLFHLWVFFMHQAPPFLCIRPHQFRSSSGSFCRKKLKGKQKCFGTFPNDKIWHMSFRTCHFMQKKHQQKVVRLIRSAYF